MFLSLRWLGAVVVAVGLAAGVAWADLTNSSFDDPMAPVGQPGWHKVSPDDPNAMAEIVPRVVNGKPIGVLHISATQSFSWNGSNWVWDGLAHFADVQQGDDPDVYPTLGTIETMPVPVSRLVEIIDNLIIRLQARGADNAVKRLEQLRERVLGPYVRDVLGLKADVVSIGVSHNLPQGSGLIGPATSWFAANSSLYLGIDYNMGGGGGTYPASNELDLLPGDLGEFFIPMAYDGIEVDPTLEATVYIYTNAPMADPPMGDPNGLPGPGTGDPTSFTLTLDAVLDGVFFVDTLPASMGAPEPATLGLLAAGAAAGLLRRRRRAA